MSLDYSVDTGGQTAFKDIALGLLQYHCQYSYIQVR